MARSAKRLSEEHHELERTFDELCNRAGAGDWRILDEVWPDFVATVEEHFAFEEHELFPRLAKQSPESGELVTELQSQHARIRAALEQIGVEIQLHSIRASTIDGFVKDMRTHAALEAARLYPWAEPDGQNPSQ